ncbi:GMC family oxidoreductase [Amycolatopsis cynarae]|uniref:GMC family oxidoreductase n=1 Tax=Amycolatopsis cynarae TaxID=2995223 RepID=A0ABY7AYJ5_9PSEU|nr:GMC family oxidoreductase [Amycolatopsis sp. HUAS 11-8]WAL64548.1 GMC family oxidoreductase [Amycolatopsis sp. HUAS 11-8]
MPEPGRALAGTVATLLGTEVGQAREIAARVDTLCAAFPAPARLGVHMGAGMLDAAALMLTGRRLDRLTTSRRDALCELLTARPGMAALAELLKVPALLAGGGAPPRPLPEPARPDPVLDCTPAAHWPARATADAVVIGSGAGGAMAARELARAGLSVVVVEEGTRYRVEDFRTRDPLDRFAGLYRDGGATVAWGRPPVLLPLGRAVGGTTVVNSGTCYRPPAPVLARWRKEAGDRIVDRIETAVPEVERTLLVAQQPLDVLGRNGLLALEGARRLGWRGGPLHRNAPGCAGSCQCAVGCPRNAKNGVHLNALPQACAAGARIVSELRVDRILVERGRAAGIAGRRGDGSSAEILAPLVVVAAGATETPPLLRRSGLGGHPWLGRNLALHPAISLAGRFADPVEPGRGVLQSAGIEQWHDEGILIEATAAPRGMGTFVLPGLGSRLRAELDGADHLATLGAMIADEPSGRVLGGRSTLLRYQLAPADERKLRTALGVMGDVLFAAGATEVLTGIARQPRAKNPAQLRDIVARVPAAQLHVAAFHPTGTARLGTDPRTSPLDPRGRLRGVRGVYVADASVLPSCPTVNPQITIMAAALAISGGIVAD